MTGTLNQAASFAALAAALLLSGCGREDDSTLVRPGTQPLERLDTAEARARIASALPRPSELPAAEAANMCGEVVRISEQGRLILDRTNPRRLVVAQALWSRLPAEVQRSLVECAEAMRPEGTRSGPMRVVTSG